MHRQGQAQPITGTWRGVAPVVPGPRAASGTGASPALARPLRRTFPGEPSQVPLARDFVRRYLARLPGPAAAVSDILLCVTELATNAMAHSHSGLPGGHFGVQIAVRADEWVQVAVDDAGGPWEQHGIDDDAECGRGLRVVSALSAEMGIIGDGSGRTVWFRCPWKPREDCSTTEATVR